MACSGRWRGVLLAAAFVLAASWPAGALVQCEALVSLLKVATGEERSLSEPPGAVSCVNVRPLGGGRAVSCYWSFGYREPAARAGLDALGEAVVACLGAAPVDATGPAVNHPDSFEQRHYKAGRALLSVSLKDKAALGFTAVFLGIDVPR